MVAIAFALGASAAAQADVRVGPVGGGGGGAFAARCPDGQLLTGFELRVGDDVDAIRPLCVLAYGKAWTSPVWVSSNASAQQAGIPGLGGRDVFSVESGVPNPGLAIVGDRLWYGGPGGRPRSLVCPDHDPIMLGLVIEAEGESTVVVHEVEIHCGKAFSEQTPVERGFSTTAIWKGAPPSRYCRQCAWGPNHVKAPASCPAGKVAVGIHGRSGKWLDAVGLICDFPQWAAAPAGPAPPPPPKSKGGVRLDAPAQTVQIDGKHGVEGALGKRSATALAVAPAARADTASAYRTTPSQATRELNAKGGNASLNPQPLPPRAAEAIGAQRAAASSAQAVRPAPAAPQDRANAYGGALATAAASSMNRTATEAKAPGGASQYAKAAPGTTLARPALAAVDTSASVAAAGGFLPNYGIGPIIGGDAGSGDARVSIVPDQPWANALVLVRAEGISRYCEGAALQFGDGTPEVFVPLAASQSSVSPPQQFERSHSYAQAGTYTIAARALSGSNKCSNRPVTLTVVVR